MNQAIVKGFTQRIAELERALTLAILTLEDFYGSDADDSDTLKHLARVVIGTARKEG